MYFNLNENTIEDNDGYKTNMSEYESKKHVFFNKKILFTLGNGDGKIEYKMVNNVHLGQLKLLLSEMQALIYYIDTTIVKTVVYVGAAHGYHIYVLAKLFPNIKFYLYDISEEWDKRLDNEKNIIKYNKYFEEEDIKLWKMYNEPFFFISDIRNKDVGKPDDELKKIKKNDTEKEKDILDTRESIVWSDMLLQQDWVKELKPAYSLLKFKLPYYTKTMKFKNYLDGNILRQFYARNSSAETRLLLSAISYRDWNLENYEKMNAYHNQVIRKDTKFLNPINGGKTHISKSLGLSNDFESTGITIIVMDYLKKINIDPNENNTINIINYIFDNCYGTLKKINLNNERKKSGV